MIEIYIEYEKTAEIITEIEQFLDKLDRPFNVFRMPEE